MKTIFRIFILLMVPFWLSAQTKIKKTYAIKNGQTLALNFDFPKIVKVSTWDKNEIEVNASVNINDGENDKNFILLDSLSDGKLTISNKIDWNNIPDTYYVQENGNKTRFNSKQDLDNYKNQNPDKLKNVSIYQQKNTEITLEIKVPAHINTVVSSIYGTIELKDFNGNIKAAAKYGSVDASLAEQRIGKIKLSNQFGKIYSNLSLKPIELIEKNFYVSLTAEPGKGPSYDISSSFGNIYLRKNQ